MKEKPEQLDFFNKLDGKTPDESVDKAETSAGSEPKIPKQRFTAEEMSEMFGLEGAKEHDQSYGRLERKKHRATYPEGHPKPRPTLPWYRRND